MPPNTTTQTNGMNGTPTPDSAYNLTGQSSTGITPSANSGYNYTNPSPSGTNTVAGYQMPNYNSFNQAQNQNQQAFTQGQQNQSQAFTNSYLSAANALPTYQTLLNNANQQYNVPTLASNANQLNNQLLQIPQTYMNATNGSDTNANQLSQLTAQKEWELAPSAEAAQNSANTAEGLANSMLQAGVSNEAQLLSPYANSEPLVQSQMQNAATSFTQDQQNELNALNQQVASGQALTQTQLTTQEQLQQAQQAYVNNLQVQALANAGNLASTIQGQKYVNVPAGNNLVNTVAQGYVNPGSGNVGSY